jgi:hypothetical protein
VGGGGDKRLIAVVPGEITSRCGSDHFRWFNNYGVVEIPSYSTTIAGWIISASPLLFARDVGLLTDPRSFHADFYMITSTWKEGNEAAR